MARERPWCDQGSGAREEGRETTTIALLLLLLLLFICLLLQTGQLFCLFARHGLVGGVGDGLGAGQGGDE